MRKQIVYLTLTLATILLNYPSVLAQSTASDANFQSNEYDSTSGSSFGNSFNPMDIIHRANMSTGRDAQEFNQDTAESLNSAAAEFKKMQLERLKKQQQESVNSNPNQQNN